MKFWAMHITNQKLSLDLQLEINYIYSGNMIFT